MRPRRHADDRVAPLGARHGAEARAHDDDLAAGDGHAALAGDDAGDAPLLRPGRLRGDDDLLGGDDARREKESECRRESRGRLYRAMD